MVVEPPSGRGAIPWLLELIREREVIGTQDWQSFPCIIGDRRRSLWIWRMMHGDPDGLYVLHYCDERLCWEPMHLYRGTQKQNMQQASQAGHMKGYPGKVISPEERAKLVAGQRAHITPEEHERRSAAQRGKFRSAESNAKRSAAQKGRVFTEEHRAKISAARRKQNLGRS
jgi:hypothetical protein